MGQTLLAIEFDCYNWEDVNRKWFFETEIVGDSQSKKMFMHQSQGEVEFLAFLCVFIKTIGQYHHW